jgi:hypothetical protein
MVVTNLVRDKALLNRLITKSPIVLPLFGLVAIAVGTKRFQEMKQAAA